MSWLSSAMSPSTLAMLHTCRLACNLELCSCTRLSHVQCLQVPAVAGFSLNVSIGSMSTNSEADFEARMTFPLFVGGERQLQRRWVGNGSLPAGMADQYTDDQLELLCVSQVSLCQVYLLHYSCMYAKHTLEEG